MNYNTILFLFLGCCCVWIGNANSDKCEAAVSAFPPNPESQCCGVDASDLDHIVGGSVAGIDQYPWLALIEYMREKVRRTFCGATLISGNYVLTSAHCVTESHVLKEYIPTSIRLGEYNTDNDGPDCVGEECNQGVVSIAIEKMIPHPDYNAKSRRNDIALIKMESTAPYTDFIRPICLPTMDVTVQKGPINFSLASWSTPEGLSPVKLHVDLPFVQQDECQKFYSKTGHIDLWKGQLCAGGEKGKDSCKGDGGMPLMYKNGRSYTVIGIVSFGVSQCGQENAPSVYTNIYEYKSWITSNIVA